MKRGLIIRLIDIVLIILFGFLAISDIQMKRQIRLPGPPKDQQIQEIPQDVYVFIQIDKNDRFTLKEGETIKLRTGNIDGLRSGLLKITNAIYENGKTPVVIIDPDLNAKIQTTIAVYDLCEEEQLPKSINMQLSKN